MTWHDAIDNVCFQPQAMVGWQKKFIEKRQDRVSWEIVLYTASGRWCFDKRGCLIASVIGYLEFLWYFSIFQINSIAQSLRLFKLYYQLMELAIVLVETC